MTDADKLCPLVSSSTGLPEKGVQQALNLFNDGATIPFVARYRKERTGGLDEQQLGNIWRAYKKYQDLSKRKTYILETIEEQGKLTPDLKDRILSSWSESEIEDLYLPFKSKRKTRADKAMERGLEPLAKMLMSQRPNAQPEQMALKFRRGEVKTVDEALQGARDIIAGWINENTAVRNIVRSEFKRSGYIFSNPARGKEKEAEHFRDYFDFSEKLSGIPSHRVLAVFRGENKGLLSVKILPDEEKLMRRLRGKLLKNRSAAAQEVEVAITDAWKRLLQPGLETEFRKNAKEKADEEAIGVFADNLRQLLLAPPLGPARVLALDPGFRSGCKTVCLNESGELLFHTVVYPHPPQNQGEKAAGILEGLVKKYRIQAIAVGNGTAGRETMDFLRSLPALEKVEVYLVNEAGASIYSASPIAAEEFPDHDLTVRGAVSIGRRLMDPLAELVKIEPGHIGVGQYQHDVDQKLLTERLREEVEFCVNQVGVNLHTASKHLLTYVSGLGPALAQSLVDYRSQKGGFQSRAELKKVPGLGPKAFQQCAGFLRLPGSDNPLDNTGVHPESYNLVKKIARDLGGGLDKLLGSRIDRGSISLEKYTNDQIGLPTLKDILDELEKPGLDPRGKAEEIEFSNIQSMEDLEIGMELKGIVSNIAKFGAFVDLGIKESGLIHISQMSDRFISDPSKIVKLGQMVKVEVISVDLPRKRISLRLLNVN